MISVVDIGALYAASRQRICALVLDAGEETARNTAAQACPGWSVRDVVAHLVGVVEDGLAGRLTGPPDDTMTADEVDRHAHDTVQDMTSEWQRLAPTFEAVLTERQIWAAMIDVISHEHDIRTALGVAGARSDVGVILAAQRLAVIPDSPVAINVQEMAATSQPTSNAAVTLTSAAFEIIRFRLGRRSIEQVLELPWSADPTPYLADLFVFGPADQPLIE